MSRAIGDIEAKSSIYGGILGVISSVPEIIAFKLKEEIDFILLGCDGIFDQLSNKEVIDCVWMLMKTPHLEMNIHQQSGKAVDMIIKSAMTRKSLDNVTSTMITFNNFLKHFELLSNPNKGGMSLRNNLFNNNLKSESNLTTERSERDKRDKTRKFSPVMANNERKSILDEKKHENVEGMLTTEKREVKNNNENTLTNALDK